MAYDIRYYSDRAMRNVMPDCDKIGDWIERYPAPTGKETAFAGHSSDKSLSKYGYDGGWHDRPPPEVAAADDHDEEDRR